MVAKYSTRPYLRPSLNTKAFAMSHAIPNEINQSLIQTNTRAAQAWVDKVRQEAHCLEAMMGRAYIQKDPDLALPILEDLLQGGGA